MLGLAALTEIMKLENRKFYFRSYRSYAGLQIISIFSLILHLLPSVTELLRARYAFRHSVYWYGRTESVR